MNYEVIVVGGGHAGCEAAYASAKIGKKTLLVTTNINNIADMPCNPSIGGTAKGIIVREIDALGGLMGKVADYTHLQIKMLNNKKGPGVRSLRAQADKVTYPALMRKTLMETQNLTILEDTVKDLIVENNVIKGIELENNKDISCNAVILTTGTYTRSKILIGDTSKNEGPHGQKPANELTPNLKKKGLELMRLKTGTPPRIKKSSINFTVLKEEVGDSKFLTFSYDLNPQYKIEEQEKCYLTYTNLTTHQIIKDNLSRSSMFGGFVEGVGPRYCPSIEDKVVRFKEKDRHQLFLEPESLEYDDWYLQGFSTSMPIDVQEKMVHSLVGLENAVITKYAYAIEYDAINPLQMKPSLESKVISNLFTAGQINGTSGYEEAAGQGLIAGINATLQLDGKEPLILKRNESYIGVLIDDLVTKGTKEPYRMLTSRAEFRLILRHDNADIRLRRYGYGVGLISQEQIERLNKKQKYLLDLKNILKETQIKINSDTLEIFSKHNLNPIKSSMSLLNLLKRPEIEIEFIKNFIDLTDYSDEILEELEIEVKYEGYIKKSYREAEKLLKLENKQIPDDIDYSKVYNLASEARQKLSEVHPKTIAQATRISGVNPADISILAVYLKKEYNK